MKRKTNLVTLTLLIFIIIPYLQTNTSITIADLNNNPISPIDIISADSPISITSYAELIAASFPGTGASNDPYRIEDLVIITEESAGIHISGISETVSHFLIRNCTIDAADYGIDIFDIIAGRTHIWNCTIYNADIGIRVQQALYAETMNNTIYSCSTAGVRYDTCHWSYIYNNTIYNTYRGIYVTNSYHPYVYYNYVHHTQEQGILVEDSDEIVVQYNDCEACKIGIESYSSINPFLGNNYISDSTNIGLYSRYSNYARIGGNDFHDCGLGVYDSNVEDLLTLQVTSNYIDGSLIYYAENLTNENIWVKYSQFILVNCSNVQISSQDQLAYSLGVAIKLLYCTNVAIRYCYFNNALTAINFQGCENIKIYNNTLNNNPNVISAAASTGGFIRENVFYNGTIGINFAFEVNDFDIYQNNFQNFSLYGIVFEVSNNNTFYHNNLINCGSGSSYGYDGGTGNVWYNTTLSEGNYWSNWVSSTYSIDGPEGSVDMYPLSSPYVPPVVPEYKLLSWFAVVFLVIIPGMIIYLKKRR